MPARLDNQGPTRKLFKTRLAEKAAPPLLQNRLQKAAASCPSEITAQHIIENYSKMLEKPQH
jgi:hypothetical protein